MFVDDVLYVCCITQAWMMLHDAHANVFSCLLHRSSNRATDKKTAGHQAKKTGGHQAKKQVACISKNYVECLDSAEKTAIRNSGIPANRP